MRGFGTSESVLLSFDTGAGTRSLVRVQMSQATGSANTSFVVPASTDGKHRVSATGNKSSSTYSNFVTRPSAYLIAEPRNRMRLVRVQLLGFAAAETVTARFDSQYGAQLGSLTTSATGSGSVSVRIPGSTSPGTHYLWLLGSDGNNVRVTLSVGSASVPTPEPTASSTPTEPAPTEIASEIPPTNVPPTLTVTAEPTASETPVPPTQTETAIPPIPTSTESPPTVIPTETVVPDDQANETSTVVP